MKGKSPFYSLLRALIMPLQLLPLRFHYAWASVISHILEKWMHYRKDVVIINLSRSFPDKKYAEIKRIAHDFYLHLGEVFAESIWFGSASCLPKRLHRQHLVEIKNIDLIDEAYRKYGNMMVLTSHFGNWELTGGFFEFLDDGDKERLSFTPRDCTVVYKKLESKFWDWFIARNRTAPLKDFEGYVETREVLRRAFELRSGGKGSVYIFPTDQFPYAMASKHEIPSFMNQKTFVMTGGIKLAEKFGMPVFYMSMDRVSRGHYEIVFKTVSEDGSLDAVEKMVENYYGFLEEDVSRNPANYLWSHKRWK